MRAVHNPSKPDAMILLIQSTAINWLAVALALVSSGVLFGVIDYNRNLKKFRQVVKVGDMVTVKMISGRYIRGRIVAKQSDNLLSVCDIDDLKQYSVAITQIFEK